MMNTIQTAVSIVLFTLTLAISPFLSFPTKNKQDKPVNVTPVPPVTAPGVFVKDDQGRSIPLAITKLDVTVQVTGTIAATTLDMTVSNPHNRILEGEFSFPVADGQTVSRFALDINGKLRDAVVVSKSKGRSTFEEVIRTKVDPALLEWTRDNSFRARIYPIPAKGTRRVVITYEQSLTSVRDGLAYTIPFAYPQAIHDFLFHATVAGSTTAPSLTGASDESVEFTPKGRTFTVEIEESDFLVNKPFTIAVPVLSNVPRVMVQRFDEKDFTALFLNHEPKAGERTNPTSITVFWDASISGLKRDTDKELRFLQELITETKPKAVEVVAFANTVIDRKTFSSNTIQPILSFIHALPMDGGTQLGIVPFDEAKTDVAILFSDGISTFGKHQPRPSSIPLLCVVSSAQTDHATVHALAEQSSGAYIDLQTSDIADAVQAALTRKRTIESIEVLTGAMDSIRPAGVRDLDRNTVITGILRSAEATIRITTSLNGRNQEVETVSISAAEDLVDGSSIPRLWAAQELQRLSSDRMLNADAITQIGQRFTLVTPGTSLIVLERIEDYLRFAIQPPATEPELVKQYASAKKDEEKEAEDVRRLHREQVLTLLRSATATPASNENKSFWLWKSNSSLPSNTAAGNLGTIKGSVVTTRNQPIPHATIVIPGTPLQTISDGNGAFTIANVPTGNIRIAANLDSRGYRSTVQTVNAGKTTAATFTFADAPKNAKDALAIARKGMPAAKSLRLSRMNTESIESAESTTTTMIEGLTATDLVQEFTGQDADRVSGMVAAPAPAPSAIADLSSDDEVQTINEHFFTVNANRTTVQQTTAHRDAWADTLAHASDNEIYQRYLSLRPQFFTVTGYYLDAADALIAKGKHELALRVLSSLAELQGEDARAMRILAHRLMQIHHQEYAALVFRDVLRVRDEEPQSYRDLGLALAACGNNTEAIKQFTYILEHPWHNRFPEVELIAARELSKIVFNNPQTKKLVDTSYLIPFVNDVRVVLTWDADNCDMDLWVTDPSGEVCMYNHRNTKAGGSISRDLVGGYGPEEFVLPIAPKGGYKIQVHYYGDRQQSLDRPTTIQVDMFTRYGYANEQHDAVTMRVDGVSRVIDVGTILVN